MLSHEDNETLVRVGPGTPMGEFQRLYWIPFLLSKDLVADGQPKRVKLLGENLVAFRASDNAVGLVDNACAHRGAPLIYARNEECGLRCVYHGWKFDVNGQVIDMPAEPAHSRFKDKVRIKAYPCRERNGVVWTYMGRDHANPPPLPNIEWNLVPEERSHISMRVQECNWLQALEGEIDSAHAPILHGRIDGQGRLGNLLAGKDLRPVFECVRQEFGVSIAARRNLPDGRLYWRVNQFVLPFYTMVPPQSKYPELSGHAWVPMDDEHTLCLMFTYHPSDPLLEKMRGVFEEGHNNRESGHASRHAMRHDDTSLPYAGYWTKFNRETDFHFNYETQQTTWFSGLPGLWVQDAACQSGIAPIYDRTKERLGVSDSGIVVARRSLIEAVRAHRDKSVAPAGVNNPDLFMVRAASLQLAPEEAWSDVGRQHMTARLGAGFGYVP